MYNLDILDFVPFRTCNMLLRKVDYLTLIFYEYVAHGMNYLLTSGSLTPCQSFARNCLVIFMISSVLIFYRDYLIF